jgi:GTP-binding protein
MRGDMNIKSATFVKGAIGTDDIFEDGTPQIVFVGRSNVGKSSVINSLANQKNLARTSSTPGRTQQINIFLINKAFYLIDLPGYGFAKVPEEIRQQIQKMINWYLFRSDYNFKKVVLIIDAKVGPTNDDMEMLRGLEETGKDIIIVANKIDKIKKAEYEKQLEKIKNIFDNHKVIPYSAEKKIGVGELIGELVK